MTVLTEVLEFKVNDACEGGIFLRWQNDSGAVDQWLFTGNITEKPSVSDVQYFEKNIDDLDGVTSNFEVLKKSFANAKTCYTTFDKDNAEGFKQLIRSRFIQMYNNGYWYQVDVKANSFNIDEFNPYGKISIDVVLPKIYVK